jgi:uracil-DNA glycosylase
MSLELDSRRVAMLAEMGLRLYGPQPHEGNPVGAPPAPPREAGEKPAVAAGAGPVAAKPTIARAGVELMQWDALAEAVASCRACGLCEGRRNAVFGAGDRQADWLVVDGAPGEDEDVQGEPFAGQTGQLLDNMLKALGLARHDKVYLANVLKCRPPGDRNPDDHEVAQCEPFLRRQVELLRPKVILAMGPLAAQSLLGTAEPVGKLRGRLHRYMDVPVVVTFHAAYLLRNLPEKAKAWADLCLALEVMRGQPAGDAPAGR